MKWGQVTGFCVATNSFLVGVDEFAERQLGAYVYRTCLAGSCGLSHEYVGVEYEYASLQDKCEGMRAQVGCCPAPAKRPMRNNDIISVDPD